MKKLKKVERQKIQDFLDSGKFHSMLAEELQQHGLTGYQVELKFRPIQLDLQAHICIHGKPQKQDCSESGYCRWVCNH